MNVAVIGTGHMGSWFAGLLSHNHKVAVYDKNPEKLEKINTKKVEVLDDLSDLLTFSPKIVINAVSLKYTIEAFKSIEGFIPDDCIICDIASIKNGIPDYYKGCRFRYVSIHPMFGPTFGNLDSLKKENVVIVKESDEEGKEFFHKFFDDLGVKIYYYTSSEHDSMMAYSLTTPFAATLVFTACMTDRAVPGSTFARHRSIAEGLLSEDDHLLSEILFNPDSLEQIEKITNKLEFLKHIIKGRDYDLAKIFFNGLRGNIS